MKKLLLVFALVLMSGCTLPFMPKPKITNPPKPTVLQGVAAAFQAKYPEWDMKTVEINVNSNDGIYAIGEVYLSEGMEGAMWLAYKDEGWWQIVWDGNGTIGCTDIEPYGFPVDMVPECWDEVSGEMIDRTSGDDQASGEVTNQAAEEKAIRAAIDEHDNEMKAVNVTFDGITAEVAKGSVTYPEEVGGWWLAVKENGKWRVLAVGSDIVDCAAIAPYNFPAEMVTVCYDSTTDKTVNRLSAGDFDDILAEVKSATGVAFGSVSDVEFNWYEYTGQRTIKGRGFKVDKTAGADLDKVLNYFKDRGYIDDMYNAASGTIVGAEGFMRDTIVCKVRQELYGGAAAMQLGESDMIIEVSCGPWS